MTETNISESEFYTKALHMYALTDDETRSRYSEKRYANEGRIRFSMMEPLGFGNYNIQQSVPMHESVDHGSQVQLFSWVTLSSLIYYPLYWFGIIYVLKLMFRNLPFRTTSRLVGRIARIRLPLWMREPVFRTYGWVFNVKMSESEYRDDLTKYETISAFFRRRLTSSARIVDSRACLVSPADGTVLSCGLVKAGHLEQVKGIFYSLNGLLGPNTWGKMTHISKYNEEADMRPRLTPSRSMTEATGEYVPCVTSAGLDYLPVVTVELEHTRQSIHSPKQDTEQVACAVSQSLRLKDMMYAEGLLLNDQDRNLQDQNKEEETQRARRNSLYLPSGRQVPTTTDWNKLLERKTGLYHFLVYLAPGDYHRFHSPTDWSIFMRRHFPGKLFPVSPKFLPHYKGLYCVNERVVYIGRWEHGFFAYVAVGAANVGSIKVDIDPDLITNVPTKTYAKNQYSNSNGDTEQRSNASSTRYFDQYFPHLAQYKGEHFGQFNFGSTVILIFEAPLSSFHFMVKSGSRIKVGESVGTIKRN